MIEKLTKIRSTYLDRIIYSASSTWQVYLGFKDIVKKILTYQKINRRSELEMTVVHSQKLRILYEVRLKKL